MNDSTIDDRSPGRWVSSCQRCLCYLYLDEFEYARFIKKYHRSLNSLFTSLGVDASFQVKDCSMITFFELLSRLTGIDFPLCSSCLEYVKQENIKGLNKDKTVGYVLERLIGAMTIQQKMDSIKGDTVVDTKEEEDQIRDMYKSVDELKTEKNVLEDKLQTLRVSLASIEKQKLEYEEMETELNRLQDTMNCVSSEISLEISDYSLNFNKEKEMVEDHKRQLELLMHYSALNDSFSIWFEDNTITVNGMKPTRIGNQIDWASINGVLGELAHVVDAMHALYGKSYTTVVIKPMGSYSEVIDLTTKTSYKLYFNPKNGNRKFFVQALHLFLEAVQSLCKHCSDKFKVDIRYPIENDSVSGYDFLMNDFDTWTRALRFLAIDIKQLIVYSYAASIYLKRRMI